MDEQDAGRYARAPEPADVVRICRALNEAGALYLLIGGFAVVAHGAGRFTKDIDLLVDAETMERDGVAIRVASPRTLIKLKDTPRPQDALDRAFLEGVLRARGEQA